MSDPVAAVIIPHCRDYERLQRCLDALAPQWSEAHEIVVVDNGSDIDFSALKARQPKVRFVAEPVKGAAAARNRGVAETRAPRLCFLDADCLPDPDWLAKATAVEIDNAIVGGRIELFDEGTGARTGAQAFETVFAFRQKDYVLRHGFSVTANLVTTREVFALAGPFVVGESEDVEFCRRAVAAGVELRYADDLVVRHPTRADWSALRKKWARLTEERYYSERNGRFGRWKWLARSIVVLVSPLAHGWEIAGSRHLSDWRETLAGVSTLVRLRSLRFYWMLRQALSDNPRLG